MFLHLPVVPDTLSQRGGEILPTMPAAVLSLPEALLVQHHQLPHIITDLCRPAVCHCPPLVSSGSIYLKKLKIRQTN